MWPAEDSSSKPCGSCEGEDEDEDEDEGCRFGCRALRD